MNDRTTVQHILTMAGIELNGPKPWDILVHDERFYRRVLRGGSMALGDSYLDGWWDAPRLDQFFHRVHQTNLGRYISRSPKMWWSILRAQLFNDQTISKSRVVGEQHYDLGNDLYEAMLDRRMTYTCGYWATAKNLDEAQEAKLDLTCRKLWLKPGMRVLDIGCGWGSFAKFVAEKYGVEVVGVTISKEQAAGAEKSCRGLPVRIRLEDYRQTSGTFDRVVSLGMVEHVGKKNYAEFFRVARKRLKDDGIFLLHTIGTDTPQVPDPWIEKYIFPNSMLPAMSQLEQAFEKTWNVEDWHNFGPDYDRTLMAWMDNVTRHWPELRKKYDQRFQRMWTYYLMASAGSFRARVNQLWQIVFTPTGSQQLYRSVR